MMKRFLVVSFIFTIFVLSAIQPVAGATITKSDMDIYLDGTRLSFAESYVVDDRLVVPYRAIAEKLGATVEYRSSDKRVFVKKAGKTIELKIGSKVATVSREKVTLDVSATLIGNSTYVPIRFLAENFNINVTYNGANRSVFLNTNEETYQVDIRNFAFSQKEITITAGSTIVFVNQDSAIHTVTARDKSFDSGDLKKGESYTRTFAQSGEYVLYCIPHDFMEIKVIVK